MSQDPLQDFEAARQRLAAKGLLEDGDSLSCRLPASRQMLLFTQDHQQPAPPRCVPLDAPDEAALAAGRIYSTRPDVGAILFARLHWSGALSNAGQCMPGVFDEQLRHLGAKVRRLADGVDDKALSDGANAYGLPDGVLSLGMNIERLIFNVELLEKCAMAYTLALTSGREVRRIPWLVRRIATGRLRRDQRDAAAHHARGEFAPRKAGY